MFSPPPLQHRFLKPNNAYTPVQLRNTAPTPIPAEREPPMDGLGLERLSRRGIIETFNTASERME